MTYTDRISIQKIEYLAEWGLTIRWTQRKLWSDYSRQNFWFWENNSTGMPLHLTAGNMSAKSVQNQNWAKVSVCSFKVRQGPKMRLILFMSMFCRSILSLWLIPPQFPYSGSRVAQVFWRLRGATSVSNAGDSMTCQVQVWQVWRVSDKVWASMTSILASAGSNISLKCRCLHKRWLLISDHWTIMNIERGKFNWKQKYWDDNSERLRTSLIYLASSHPFICKPWDDLAKKIRYWSMGPG